MELIEKDTTRIFIDTKNGQTTSSSDNQSVTKLDQERIVSNKDNLEKYSIFNNLSYDKCKSLRNLVDEMKRNDHNYDYDSNKKESLVLIEDLKIKYSNNSTKNESIYTSPVKLNHIKQIEFETKEKKLSSKYKQNESKSNTKSDKGNKSGSKISSLSESKVNSFNNNFKTNLSNLIGELSYTVGNKSNKNKDNNSESKSYDQSGLMIIDK